jgi:hypothetical protein
MNFSISPTKNPDVQSTIKNPSRPGSDVLFPALKLIFIGLATQIIYVIYIVVFPLIANTQKGGPAADLEILMRDYRWFAPIYAVGIFLLYYLFWQAIKIVSSIKYQVSNTKYQILNTPQAFLKILVLTFGLLFGFTLTWLYPITAYDLFLYVLRGRVWAIYGQSPMLAPPADFLNDPYIDFAGEFGNRLSNYGPLWEILVQGPLRLGATDMVPGTISVKLLVLICYLLCAILIGWVAIPQRGSSLAALIFFTWNPLILMQAPGNGHNDMVFMLLMVLGLILWQRKLWWAAAIALTLAVLAKAAAALLIPLFVIVLLRNEPTWGQRIVKGGSVIIIGLVLTYLTYSALGPVTETFQGMSSLTTRRGFAIASGLRMVLRETNPRGTTIDSLATLGTSLNRSIPCEAANITQTGTLWLAKIAAQIIPCHIAEAMPRTMARNIFAFFYGWLLVQLWRKKFNLVTAGFLAYFSQLMLGQTFRIWYPMWLVPLAALHLTPATFWRTFLFGLTAELSIINYFVVWRWWLRDLPWDKLGLLAKASFYWPVMHLLTVPWVFGIPLFGPIIIERWQRRRQQRMGNKANNTQL